MTSKFTPSLNEAITRRTKRSTAGINSRYNQTPSLSPKTIQKSARKSSKSSKSTPLNVNAKIFSSKSICTSGNKSAKELQTLLLEERKQLESRLEKQISKTNVLEKELEGLKKKNSFLKTEFQSQMNNIELIINNNNNNNNDIDCNDFSTSQDTGNELNTNTNSTLDFSIVRENPPAAAKPPLSVPLNQGCGMPKRDYRNAVKNSIAVSTSPQVNIDVNRYFQLGILVQ